MHLERSAWRALWLGLALLLGAPGAHPVELKVANWAGPEEIAIERANIEAFRRRHPGVGVQLEPIPSRYREKILISMAAGTAPDVFLLDAIMIPTFVQRLSLIDLSPYIARHGVDLGQYYPNVLDVARQDGCLYALPKDFTPMVMYYNKDLFDSAGVPYPPAAWTWDDFVRLARRLTRDTDGDGRADQYGTVTPTSFFVWPPWVWSNGGDFLAPDGRRASGFLDSAPTTEALQFLIDLQRQHHVAPRGDILESSGGDIGMFANGRLAMAPGGHWWLPQLKQYLEEGRLRVGVAPLPNSPGGERVNVIYSAGWCVSAQTRWPDLAAQLAIHLSSVEANRRRMAQRLAIPANVALAEQALRADPFGLEEVFYGEIPHCRPPWGARVERFARVEDISEAAFEEALVMGTDLRSALRRAARQIDAELSAPEPKAVARKTRIMGFLAAAVILGGIGALASWQLTWRSGRREAAQAWFFLAPSFLHLIVFIVGPLLFSLYLAGHAWSVAQSDAQWVGLSHFRRLFADPLFWNSVKNTAIFALHVPVAMAISLSIALAMNTRLRGITIFRTLFFVPSVASIVASAMVWKWLYNYEYGLLNFVLRAIGLDGVAWLDDPRTALLAVMFMMVWLSIGHQMVIFIAGLQGIPQHLYEAARIDGAGRWQCFWRITLPLLRPTTFFVLVISTIASFQVFTPVYVMTQGRPVHSTEVLVYHIYQNAWEYLHMGYASAMAWVLFAILLVAMVLQFRWLGREVEYS